MKKKLTTILFTCIAILLVFYSCKKTYEAPAEDRIFANFSAESNNNFIAPSEITFTDLSVFTDSNAVAEYLWYFDSTFTSTSTLQNPVHIYNTPGIYDVKLIVSIPDIETQEITIPVKIKHPFESVFEESFEGYNPVEKTGADLPDTWVVIDNDGGTPFDTDFYTAAWKIKYNEFMKSDVAVATSHYTNTPVLDADDWMISPPIALTDTFRHTVKWIAMSLTESGSWPDSYQVYVSSTTQDIAGCLDAVNGKMIKEVVDESWSYYATSVSGNGEKSYEIDISEFLGDTIHLGFRLMTPAPGGSELAIDSVIVRKYFHYPIKY